MGFPSRVIGLLLGGWGLFVLATPEVTSSGVLLLVLGALAFSHGVQARDRFGR